MPFEKGHKLSPGRRPGVPNAITADIKEMLRQALDGVGGVEYLKRQAIKNPGPFLALIGKTIPNDIKVQFTNPLMKMKGEDVAELIVTIARTRGYALPSSVARLAGKETGLLQTVQQTETIP